MKFQGFVVKINAKDGRGKRGPWTAYSAKLEKEDGTEYDQWVSLGFEKPPFKEGDFIRLETEAKDGRQQYIEGTGKIVKNAPARASKGGTKGGGSSQDEAPATGISNALKQQMINFQAARAHAVELVDVLLTHKALPMSGASTKAGEVKRFAEITAAVDKLTVEFYHDTDTLRLLKEVADAGAKVVKNDPLPEDSDEGADSEEEEEEDDDGSSEGEGWEDDDE